MSPHGIVIHEDGTIEACREMVNGGTYQVFCGNLDEVTVDDAKRAWGEFEDDEMHLERINPAYAPVYIVTTSYEAMMPDDVAAYVSKLEFSRAAERGE